MKCPKCGEAIYSLKGHLCDPYQRLAHSIELEGYNELEETERRTFLRNVYFLSTVAQYNPKRLETVQLYYDHVLMKVTAYNNEIKTQDIKEYYHTKLAPGIPSQIPNLFSISKLTDLRISYPQLLKRYQFANSAFIKHYGFSIKSLLQMEIKIRSLILNRFKSLGKSRAPYHYKTWRERRDNSFVAHPPEIFIEVWSKCITFSREELFTTAREKNISKEDLEEILFFLSRGLDFFHRPADSFLKPLIKLNDGSCIIPFPELLGSTTQMRVEMALPDLHIKVTDLRNATLKYLTRHVFPAFEIKKIANNLQYAMEGEVVHHDFFFVFENSLWVVEVISDPVLKRVPLPYDILFLKFREGVVQRYHEGAKVFQSPATLELLLQKLRYSKKPSQLVKGVLVLFDGFVPTLLTQNEVGDRWLRTSHLYEIVKKPVRLCVLDLSDLLYFMKDENKAQFENFLIWRTNHLGKFPIIADNEKEYWAYFIHSLTDKKFRKQFASHLETNDPLWLSSFKKVL